MSHQADELTAQLEGVRFERDAYASRLAELQQAVQAFLAQWDVAAPKLNGFITLAAVRSGNFNIYDGPNMGQAIETMRTLTKEANSEGKG